MTKGSKQLLLLAGAGALAYYFFVHKKADGTSEFSNIGGRKARRKVDKHMSKLCRVCARRGCSHPPCKGYCGCP